MPKYKKVLDKTLIHKSVTTLILWCAQIHKVLNKMLIHKSGTTLIFFNLALLVKASFYHIVCAPANFTKNVSEVDGLVPTFNQISK